MNKDFDELVLDCGNAENMTMGVKGYGSETRGTRMSAPLVPEK